MVLLQPERRRGEWRAIHSKESTHLPRSCSTARRSVSSTLIWFAQLAPFHPPFSSSRTFASQEVEPGKDPRVNELARGLRLV